MKIKLTKPVVFGTERVEELTLREEIVSGDLRGLSWAKVADKDHDALMKIAGRLCAQPDAVMFALSLQDTAEVVSAVLGFFR